MARMSPRLLNQLRRSWRNAPRRMIVAGLIGVFLIALGIFIVRAVYDDHQELVTENKNLSATNANLKAQLEDRKNNLSTTDPVFPNLVFMVRTFSIYKEALNGEPCAIEVTSPPESASIAKVMAQFAHSATNCYTFGPEDTPVDADAEKHITDGMVSETIVFHAAKDDKAADALFNNLSNQIAMQRSYDLPPIRDRQIPDHVHVRAIWLQFGPNVKWNSEGSPSE